MSPNYAFLTKPWLHHLVEEAAERLTREYRKVLDAWMESCAERWCPEAMDRYRKGDSEGALLILKKGNFSYTCLPNDIYEFRQGDTALARCKIEWNITGTLRDPTP